MFDLIIKNGNVVLSDTVKKVDIGIKNEKISCIAEEITEDAKQVIDANGQYVMPGMIDTHVHISEPGRTEWEGFETGSKALAAGGTTSYVEMPLNALPATTNKKALDLKLEAAKTQNYVDYGFYGGLIPDNLEDLKELSDAGVLAFKCFLSNITSEIPDDFVNVDDYTLYKGMQKLAELDQILCIHAENPSVTSKLEEEFIREGKTSAMDYPDARPVFTEVEAVQRALLFAKETGCKLHIVHISTSEAVQAILKARSEGVDVTVESCPHYFAMSAEDVEEIGAYAKCQPPLRKKADHEKLWDELLNGNIDWLTSDHSPCTEDLKLESDNLFTAWGGISGAQNNVDLMFDLAVKQRGLSVNRFVELIATTPAKRFNLSNKGEITVGKDADIILVDPEQSYVVKREDLYYKNKHSAYEGRKIDCRVTKTIVRGNVVYDLNEGIIGEPIGKLMTK
ncbi:allantoinase AllB [Ornithinibacillus halotolerans]|uniref:Allantoinase n=1 Tax=Ornithinibacillus halotolerans TaxID=1274357 RepID=A0A916W4T9_9BACI|nr:allantoinase AllB [Ornithinibacillus halotolerans]GGA65986.1 allantoinase [Ornithinibacillus halotolerans]